MHNMKRKGKAHQKPGRPERRSDPTECAALRLGLMRQVDDGTGTPSRRRSGSGPVSTAGTRSQCSRSRLLPEWKRADRVGLNQKSSAIFADGPLTGRVATTRGER